jgi:molybdate transport system regulatory protein
MNVKSKTGDSLSVQLRLRIERREKITLGPGKAELLSLIKATGSLSKAARRMDMSYMKAWLLVQTMKPLVEMTRGGQSRGGAKLTETGRKALALYQKMQRDCLRASQNSWKQLRQLLDD